MNRAEINDAIMRAWDAGRPMTDEQAAAVAKDILVRSGFAKQSDSVKDWIAQNPDYGRRFYG